MDRNVAFKVKHIYGGDDLTAVASCPLGHISFLDSSMFSLLFGVS